MGGLQNSIKKENLFPDLVVNHKHGDLNCFLCMFYKTNPLYMRDVNAMSAQIKCTLISVICLF